MSQIGKLLHRADQEHSSATVHAEPGNGVEVGGIVRDLLATNQAEKLEGLRAALLDGEQSGEPRHVDPAEFRKRMTERVAEVPGIPGPPIA